MFFDPTAQVTSSNQAGFIVIRAVINRARMWNVDGDHRDVCIPIFRGYHGRNVLVGLELDRQIHPFAHQQIGVALGGFRVVAIVNSD